MQLEPRDDAAAQTYPCTISNTAAGDYYIMLRAYATYSGVTLQGSF